MDTDDMAKLMEAKSAKTRESEGLNRSPPIPRPHRNPDEERINWELRSLQVDSEEKLNDDSIAVLSNNRCCKPSFSDLKPIKLCEMKVPMTHEGRYLVCKSIGKPLPVSGMTKVSSTTSLIPGVHCLIEDLYGDVEEVRMYNFLRSLDNLDWISPGTIFIIKEPWLRYGSKCNKFTTIKLYDPSDVATMQIYSPSDVIFVDPCDEEFLNKIGASKWYIEMSKDAEEWRKKGNECFKEGKYEMALTMYERGIRCNPELPVLYLNKALTCLRTGAYYDGYKAAEVALAKGGDREKALYRLGQAAYGMREWRKAAKHFLEILKDSPEHAEASEQFKHATTRFVEEKDAKYDFKSMHIEGKKEKPNLDVADYVGPIEIANIPGKGRGIIASEDIQEGTLLLVSKAFATAYIQDCSSNLFKMQTNDGPQLLLQIKTMQTLQKNPQKAKEIYDLYAGDDDMPHEEIPEGVIDAERIQKICEEIRFGSNDNDHYNLFTLPSYFNHACLANSYRTFYGDVIVMHAIDNIKKGDEITVAYLDPFRGYLDRKKMLSDRWKFTCHCKLCELDAADPYCLKRDQLFEEFNQYDNYSPQEAIKKGEPLLEKIRETYVNRKELQVVLAQMLLVLADAYYAFKNMTKVKECFEEIISLMNNPLKREINLPNIRVNLAVCYSDGSDANDAQKSADLIEAAMNEMFFKRMDSEHFQMLFPQLAPLFQKDR